MRNAFKSALAVIVGFVVSAFLAIGSDYLLMRAYPGKFGSDGSTHDNPILGFVLVYCMVYETLGCYFAALLAPAAPMRHALILGYIGVAISILQLFCLWATAPAWYHVAAVVAILPCAWVGGRLRLVQIEARLRAVTS